MRWRRCTEDVDLVLVHDAARPLTPPAVTDRVVAALRDGAQVVVPAVEVVDTCARSAVATSRTLDRAAIRAVQTPQGFRAEVLRRHTRRPTTTWRPTTRAWPSGWESRSMLVEGDARAVKVTRAADLLLAEAMVSDQDGS